MKFAKLLMATAAAVGTLFMVTGCGESPTQSYQKLVDAIKTGDLKTANNYSMKPITEAYIKWDDCIFSKLVSVDKEEIDGNSATVHITVKFKFGNQETMVKTISKLIKSGSKWKWNADDVTEFELAPSKANLKQIGLICRMYAGDYGEKYPDDLSALPIMMPHLSNDPKIYIAPHDKKRVPANFISFPKNIKGKAPAFTFPESNLSYAYVGKGTNESFSPDCPMAFEKPDVITGGVVNVLFIDGSVRFYKLKNPNPKTCRQIIDEVCPPNAIPDKERKVILANADAIDRAMGK